MKIFKFEHHKQAVIPFKKFLFRMSRYFLFCFILVVFSLMMGISGYYLLGKISLLDSFHMSCMILTGMGPVAEMTTPGAKLFSSLYALYSGIAFLSISAVFLSPVIHRILHILHVDK
jgi:hypothetical protein